MARTINPPKREAERKYPHRVEQHGHLERKPGEMPVDYARFYFASADDAEAFRRQCGS
jgi:hypothetical protein